MTFQQLLASIVDDTRGALAAAIMGSDGLPVEEYAIPHAGVDLPALAVEFQRVLEEARKVAGALGNDAADELEELVLVTTRHQLFFRRIDDEYSLALALTPTGVLGKARWRVRALLQELREAL
jgi:predicted regulator of Ras-like GTPase activity (Roadblock/LC7/MglB family)